MTVSFSVLFTLGLPLMFCSWYLFDNLLGSGKVERGRIDETVKDLKKRFEENPDDEGHLLTSRWMKFGGGFYGLAALYTFIVVEITDFAGFVFNFPGFSALFEDGLISFLVEFFVNQIMNLVTAFIWFTWWGTDAQVLFNFGVAFAAYYAGMYAAEHDIAEKIRSQFRGS